ncbi:MAG: class I SAM-dependent methyltransferase [Subdoligranulum sp.]|nr:class I SAM-dependent methyltransferase [Subdoligranulum sp.]
MTKTPVIRENIPAYLAELRQWLDETKDVPLEGMDGFFTARIEGYEAHMAVWEKAYGRTAALLPEGCGPLLDLGCGTGLELDRIFARWPDLPVTGIDLCAAMLEKLRAKHAGRRLTLQCADYLTAGLGDARYGAVLSVQSLHHFTPAQKSALYCRIYQALRPGGFFLEVDYIACCGEEETLLRAECARRRARDGIPAEQFVHFDTPLTLPHELALLRTAGFYECEALDSIAGATFVRGMKPAVSRA